VTDNRKMCVRRHDRISGKVLIEQLCSSVVKMVELYSTRKNGHRPKHPLN